MENSENKKILIDSLNTIAKERDKWIKRNRYYYKDLKKLLFYNIPPQAKVLEIGCGTGELLSAISPENGTGIDISEEMISIAKVKYPNLKFFKMDAENLELNEKFDFVIISDTLSYFEDIQKAFSELKKVITPDTRILITYHNFLWSPILKFAELLRLKMPQKRLNWLNKDDIIGLLNCEGYEVIVEDKRFLLPKNIPIISFLVNKYIAFLPIFNYFCITGYIISRLKTEIDKENNLNSVSVIVPARNEKGNIKNIVEGLNALGEHIELIFVEGHSTDGTYEEIINVCQNKFSNLSLKYFRQTGIGKADAVRKGFSEATGDILLILDADLTVSIDEIPKFLNVMRKGIGEFVFGSRLVYPMEKESMRFLNILGNKFFSMMFSWILNQRIKDTLCGTKVISKKNYEKLISNRSYFGDFDPFGDYDLIFGASKLNLKMIEIPIRYKARTYGETNISRFKHGLLLLKMTLFALNKIKFK